MKKKEKADQKIVPFPGLKERLLAVGLEHLEKQQFEEAVKMLGQANKMDPENQEIGTAFLLALYESGNFENARDLCKNLLHKGIGNYFEIIDVYLMILIQLSFHEEVVNTIKALLDENEVPIEKIEHYEKLLQFSQNRIGMKIQATETHDQQQPIEPFFSTNDIRENTIKIANLANQNIYPYLGELIQYLRHEKAHPFLQTMVLNVLREHGIEKSVYVKKFNFEGNFIPTQLNSVFETSFYLELIEYLKESTEHDNPTLYMQIKEMIDRHFFLLYPFELTPANKNLWSVVYDCFGQELYGETIDLEKVAKDSEMDVSSLASSISFIKSLEEISLPIV